MKSQENISANLFHSLKEKVRNYFIRFKHYSHWKIFLSTITIILIILFWTITNYYHDRERVSKRSIAILPFINLNHDNENGYFADGMTDEIISKLSKISDIMTIARNSVFQYKDTQKNISTISEELGVAVLFKGSSLIDKDKIIISGELIESRTGSSLWKKTFNNKIDDIFDIQQVLVEMIAKTLNANLSNKEKTILNLKPTQSLKAYNYYLNGRSEYFKNTFKALEKSIVYFKQALNFDPSFALAYNGMADSYSKMFLINHDQLNAELSLQASTRTLLIDNNIPEAYSSRALIMNSLGRITESIELFNKARKLGLPSEFLNLEVNYLDTGNLSEALKHQMRINNNDPKNSRHLMKLGWIYQSLEAYDDFNLMINKAIDRKPNDILLHSVLIHQFCFEGRWDEARVMVERLLKLYPRSNYANELATDFFLFSRDFNRALLYLQKLQYMNFNQKTALSFLLYRKWGKSWATPLLEEIIDSKLENINQGGDVSSLTRLNLSLAYSAIGDKESAIEWLENSVTKGWIHYKLIEIDPRFDIIRQDPRYQAEIEKMKSMVFKERMESGYNAMKKL
ncbi:MAG: hypothetical protein CMG75_10370 [Candidatus Marinimicrobia bacterium]|nr:hypothetical protein [Candidatus Neomarinimicrobiota bacterium]|tara:strand:- start:1679 stop:3388 length:1710 start_codon:yes stop_codon:yes gene_type:complete